MFLELGLDELELVGLGELVVVGEPSGVVELSGFEEGIGGVDTFGKGLVCVGTGCAGLVSGFGVGIRYKTVAAIAKLIIPEIAGTA